MFRLRPRQHFQNEPGQKRSLRRRREGHHTQIAPEVKGTGTKGQNKEQKINQTHDEVFPNYGKVFTQLQI